MWVVDVFKKLQIFYYTSWSGQWTRCLSLQETSTRDFVEIVYVKLSLYSQVFREVVCNFNQDRQLIRYRQVQPDCISMRDFHT